MLGGPDSTRALKSSLFQNLGGGPLSVTGKEAEGQTEILVSNVGLISDMSAPATTV